MLLLSYLIKLSWYLSCITFIINNMTVNIIVCYLFVKSLLNFFEQTIWKALLHLEWTFPISSMLLVWPLRWKIFILNQSVITCLIAAHTDFVHCEMEVFEFRMFHLEFSWKFFVRRLKCKNLFCIKLMFMWTILIKIRLITDRKWEKRPTLGKIFHIYPRTMKLGTFMS